MPSRYAPARFSSASMSASPSSVTTPISTGRSTWGGISIKKPQCALSTSSKNSNIPKASGRDSGSDWSRGSSSCCGISSGGRMPTARDVFDTLISRSPARTAKPHCPPASGCICSSPTARVARRFTRPRRSRIRRKSVFRMLWRSSRRPT